ncbi:4-azaleucine resistance probable transporter AzlC [Gemmobacter aquatilis]|uniref:4-azaleucine resistance probable transporter AzlC n=1 Tax=Gemmobacter aquatilis TaxID=933059 RepID=A0A1H8IRV4_9RHOB|nr:AzlC family ABC transporter permease [Gemmobacter aquatilis]SEN70835.1 4-azaleucine resistance probable transporter AzlC [Gemmobacter aquatilis]
MPQSRPPFLDGILAALPIALGYFPIAFSFGVGATHAGLSAGEAMVFSVIIYSGAAQFLAVALVAGGAPLLVAAFTLIAMGLRHLIYGPALLKLAGQGASTRRAWVWAFGLTDEVFGAALGEMARGRARFSEPFMLGLGLGAYAAWVSGTLAGALAGGGALAGYPAVEAGLGFMLTALFLALLLSILTRAHLPVIAVAGAVTVAVTLAGSATTGILAGMIAGALSGLARRAR